MAAVVPVYRMRNKEDWRALIDSLDSPFYTRPTGVRTGNTREALLFNGDDKVIGFILDDAGIFDAYERRTIASTESNQRVPFPSQELDDIEFVEAMSQLSHADMLRVFAPVLEGMREDVTISPIDGRDGRSSPVDNKHNDDAVLASPPVSPASGASANADSPQECSSDDQVLANPPPSPAGDTPAVAIATSSSSSEGAEMANPPMTLSSHTLSDLLDDLAVEEMEWIYP